MAQVLDLAQTEKPHDFTIHIPLCHRSEMDFAEPSPSRVQYLATEHPIPISDRRSLPEKFRALKPSEQLRAAGQAALEALEKLKPEFHLSIVNGMLLETTGTTVMLSDIDKNGNSIFAYWDAGEQWGAASRRLVEAARFQTLSPEITTAYLEHSVSKFLPPPQALVRVVNLEEPGASLTDWHIPHIITVGTRKVEFLTDRRIYDHHICGKFYAEFMGRL